LNNLVVPPLNINHRGRLERPEPAVAVARNAGEFA
jgi:sialic acid synthase SpsE